MGETYGKTLAARGGELFDTLGAVEARSCFTPRLSGLTVTTRPALAASATVVVHQLDAVASTGTETRLRQTFVHVRLTPCSHEPVTT